MMNTYTLEIMSTYTRSELARVRGQRDWTWLLKRSR